MADVVSQSQPGDGSEFGIKIPPAANPVYLGEVRTIKPGGMTRAVRDVTHLKSGKYREKKGGKRDPKDITVTFVFNPGNTDTDLVEDALDTDENVEVFIKYPSGAIHKWSGLISDYDIGELAESTDMLATVVITPSGTPVKTPAPAP